MTDVRMKPQVPALDHYGPRGAPEWLTSDWREHQRWSRFRALSDVIDMAKGDPIVSSTAVRGWVQLLENIPHSSASIA